MIELDAARTAKKKLEDLCRQYPQLRGLGITRINGEYGVQIDLSEPLDAPLPDEMDGVPVRVEVVGSIRPLGEE